MSVVNYSRIIGGAARMMKNPSVIDSPSDRVPKKASIWDLLVLEIAAVEKAFRGLPCWLHDFREFIEAKLGQMKPRGSHNPPRRALLSRHALVPSGPLLHLLVPSRSF